MLTVFDEINRWYPPASLRVHETGRVVLHFTVNATGVAEGPFTVDEQESAAPPRLLEAAQRMLHGTQFQWGSGYKSELTVSVVFEVIPCGTVSHAQLFDYSLNLCVKAPEVNIIQP